MSMPKIPDPPKPTEPENSSEHYQLFSAVKRAMYSLPSRFESSLYIDGVLATDLFAFNSSLAATIEQQVVDSLNQLREAWDPEQRYALYEFERQPQTFPDVVLRASAPDTHPRIVMGIELKGWYILAKEKEPSFRYKVTPAVCAPVDLLVVVPWALSNVVSGSPIVLEPFVIGARYAAEYRNWYWQHKRSSTSDTGIQMSSVAEYYPAKSDKISDRPNKDGGSNFGRLARAGVMEEYIGALFDDELAGIKVSSWQKFLSIFSERVSDSEIEAALSKIAQAVDVANLDATTSNLLAEKLREMAELIEGA